MERMFMGFHTLGQVLTGTGVGTLLHLYATRLPLALAFFDGVFQFVAGMVALRVDPNLCYAPDDSSAGGRGGGWLTGADNIKQWFFNGLCYVFFAQLLLARIALARLIPTLDLRRSLKFNLKALQDVAPEALLVNAHDEASDEAEEVLHPLRR